MREAIVYLVASPECGRQHRIYEDEDVQAEGGIHALEMLLEKHSYWFVQLGNVRGEVGPSGVSFHLSEFARLPESPINRWGVGRRNPAFRGSELERCVFAAAFEAVEHTLDTWKRYQEGTIEAYALKELKIDPNRLLALTSALQTVPRAYEITEIVVIKYWYGQDWPEPHLPDDDLVLAQYSVRMPLQVEWSADEKLVRVKVLPIASC